MFLIVCYVLMCRIITTQQLTDAVINEAATKTDARRKTQEDFFNKIFTSHFICKFRKGCSKFACERELDTEYNWMILTPKLWPSALCLSRSPWLLNRIPFGRVRLSLPHSLQLVLELNCLPSVQFVGLVLPSNSNAVIWTRLHASATSDI